MWIYGILCEAYLSPESSVQLENMPFCFPDFVTFHVTGCSNMYDCVNMGLGELQKILTDRQPIICHEVRLCPL